MPTFSEINWTEDRDIVLAAVRQQGSALRYARSSLKRDRDIVLAAMQTSPAALRWAKCLSVVVEVLGRDVSMLRHTGAGNQDAMALVATTVAESDIAAYVDTATLRTQSFRWKSALGILLVRPSGEQLFVDNTRSMTVLDLKLVLQERTGIPNGQLQLVMEGHAVLLDDDDAPVYLPTFYQDFLMDAVQANVVRHVPAFTLVVVP